MPRWNKSAADVAEEVPVPKKAAPRFTQDDVAMVALQAESLRTKARTHGGGFVELAAAWDDLAQRIREAM